MPFTTEKIFLFVFFSLQQVKITFVTSLKQTASMKSCHVYSLSKIVFLFYSQFCHFDWSKNKLENDAMAPNYSCRSWLIRNSWLFFKKANGTGWSDVSSEISLTEWGISWEIVQYNYTRISYIFSLYVFLESSKYDFEITDKILTFKVAEPLKKCPEYTSGDILASPGSSYSGSELYRDSRKCISDDDNSENNECFEAVDKISNFFFILAGNYTGIQTIWK